MLLSLQSTGPEYNRIRTNIQIPWNCQYIKYHVASFNTKDILIVTDEDCIEYAYINKNGETLYVRYTFNNCVHVSFDKIKKILEFEDKGDNNDGIGKVMEVKISHAKQLLITPKTSIYFTKITRRAALVSGLYNMELDTELVANKQIVCDPLILDLANKLYLVSKQGQPIQSNIGNIEYTPSVIASIDCIIRDGVAIIQNFETYGKPIKNTVNIDSFKQIELELVDFQYQPVKLFNPMFVTIKVKPDDPPRMKLC